MLFCALVSKTCPKLSEKPKGACKGVMLSIQLDIIKHIWGNLVDSILDLGMLKIFHIH